MQDTQRAQIIDMRKRECSYAAIASQLSLSVNAVKSYYRRNHLNTLAYNME